MKLKETGARCPAHIVCGKPRLPPDIGCVAFERPTSAGSVTHAEAWSRIVPDRLGRISLIPGSPKNFASFKVERLVSACGSRSSLIECGALDQGAEGGFSDLASSARLVE